MRFGTDELGTGEFGTDGLVNLRLVKCLAPHGSLESTGTGKLMVLPPCSQVPLAQAGSNGDGDDDDVHLVRVGGLHPLVLLRFLHDWLGTSRGLYRKFIGPSGPGHAAAVQEVWSTSRIFSLNKFY
jgi:hypothetical protein